MKALITKMERARSNYESAVSELEAKVMEVCDFEAGITWCAGDGHLVINVRTANVAQLGCLIGKSRHNKLTEEEHEEYCI